MDYAGALAKYREEARGWEAVGLRGNQDAIVECLYRLGRYREAVNTARAEGIWDSQVRLTVAMALVRLRRLDEARRFLDLKRIARYLPPSLARSIPAPTSDAALLADLHLARGAELYFTSQSEEAQEEFRQADALAPRNPVVSFLGFKSSLETHRSDDALRFAEGASRIPGVFGDDARAYRLSHQTADAAASGTGTKAP